MTIKPTARLEPQRLESLPDPPPKGLSVFTYFVAPGVYTILGRHLGVLAPDMGVHSPDTSTLVSGNGYVCRNRADFAGYPSPNLIIAFDVDPGSIFKTNGYVIDEVGKPPDLVLEVGSTTNGRSQYAEQRRIYEELGIPEFWSFDHTGGHYHNAPLSLKRLAADSRYHTVVLTIEPDGVIWGYSEVLGLSVCWIKGSLCFWDRELKRYLQFLENYQDRAEAEYARANREAARANAERQARAEAEARIRELETELRRRDNA